jgi:hypothetical protein
VTTAGTFFHAAITVLLGIIGLSVLIVVALIGAVSLSELLDRHRYRKVYRELHGPAGYTEPHKDEL